MAFKKMRTEGDILKSRLESRRFQENKIRDLIVGSIAFSLKGIRVTLKKCKLYLVGG